MIKGFGFLKLLKQLFFMGLISFFTLLVGSSVSAGYTRQIGISGYSPFDQSVNISVLPKGSLLSSRIGIGKRMLVLSSKLEYNGDKGTFMYFWWYNGLPYIFSSAFDFYHSRTYQVLSQGIPEQYYICPYSLTGDETSISLNNCTSVIYTDGTRNSLKNFFSTVNLSDYYYVDLRIVNDAYVGGFDYQYMIFCTSSSELNNTVCFRGGCPSSKGTSCTPLTGSLGIHFDTMFEDISDYLISDGPGLSNTSTGNDMTGPTTGNNSVLTGDYTYGSCTYNQIIEYAESQGMTKNLCYGGLDNWDNLVLTGIYNPVPGTGKMLDDIYGYTSESGQGSYDWFLYWRNVYQNPYVYSTNVWTSKPAVLKTYFDFYSTYNGYSFDFNTVYEYCLLVKFASWGNGDIIYNGQYFKKTCEFVDNGGRDNYGSGLDGKVPNGTNWDGVGNLSGTTTYNNGVNFIQDIFNKLKANFPTKYDIGLGFLPTYIITFLCFIILFRFISH